MMGHKRSPATAGTVDRAERYAGTAGRYSPVEEKASPRPPAPWFRLWAADMKDRTADLKAIEFGILMKLLIEMHLRGEGLHDEPDRLARLCQTTQAAFRKACETLSEKRLVVRTEEGKIWSSYMTNEMSYRAEKSRVARENASKLSEKNQRKQGSNSTTADKSLESREEEDRGDGFTVPAPSPSSSTTEGVGNALGSASLPGRPYTKGDRITVPDHGSCTVDDEPYRNGSLLVVAENSDLMIVTLNDRGHVVKVVPFERSDDEDLDWMHGSPDEVDDV